MQDTAEDDVTHVAVRDLAPRHDLADDDGSEVDSGQIFEAAAQAPDGSAAGAENDGKWFGHVVVMLKSGLNVGIVN